MSYIFLLLIFFFAKTNGQSFEVCDDVYNSCPSRDGAYPVFIPSPNCDQYCQCHGGTPYRYSCPYGLYFDPNTDKCDVADYVDCGNHGGNTGGQQNNKNICYEYGSCPKHDGQQSVYYGLPDCTKFCQCSNGTPFLMDCPAGLHFNTKLNVCDWPKDAGCA